MHGALFVLVSLFAVVSPSLAYAQSTQAAEAKPNQTHEGLLVLLAGVSRHAEHLRNCDFAVRERVLKVPRDAVDGHLIHHLWYEGRRCDNVLWMRQISYQYNTDADEVVSESIVNWDGKVARGLGKGAYLHTAYDQCRIDPEPSSALLQRRINEMLGFRMQTDARAASSVVEWIQDAIAQPEGVSLSDVTFRGSKMTKVSVRQGFQELSVWFDPSKDYMIARYERKYEQGSGYNRQFDEVTEVRQVGETWVPRYARCHSATSVSPQETETVYDVERFTVGQVKPTDVQVEFPINAKVVDTINKVAYVNLPDGTHKLLDGMSPGRGVHYRPPAGAAAVVKEIDGTTHNNYRAEPLVTSEPAPLVRARLSSWIKWTIGLSAVVCLVLLIMRLHRLKRRANE